MKNLILIFFATSLILSCSGPLDKPYNKDTMDTDLKEIGENGNLEDGDKQLLAGWLMKSAFSGEDLSGKTYQQILEEAKSYKAEQEALAAKAKAEAQARKEKMQKALVVSIHGKKFIPHNIDAMEFDDYIEFDYSIQNKVDKEIKAIKFNFEIYNALGYQVGKGYNIDFTDHRIPPNGTYTGEAYFDFNKYNDDDNRLASANFEDLMFNIDVVKIVYSDGSVLE